MATRMEVIYRDKRRVSDFKVGFRQAMRAAAEFIDQWEGQPMQHRLADILLNKFNMSRKLRKAKTRA